MAKTHKAIQEAIKEGRRRHLARYYEPRQKPGVDSATIHKWQFEQAMTNLVAMLESYNDIGVDWGMDDDALSGRRQVDDAARRYRLAGSSLPIPGAGTLCIQTAENAIRNYIELVTTYHDVEELGAKVTQSQWIVQIRAVLARMTWYLHHEGPDYCAKKLAEDGHEKEAIAILRETVSRARKECLTELKRLLAKYSIYEQPYIIELTPPEVKTRFTFSPGQICFDENDLQLPTGLTIEVFEKLYQNWGKVVLYCDLDLNSEKAEASIQLKSAKMAIMKVLKSNEIPCIVENKQRTGYLIKEKTH